MQRMDRDHPDFDLVLDVSGKARGLRKMDALLTRLDPEPAQN